MNAAYHSTNCLRRGPSCSLELSFRFRYRASILENSLYRYHDDVRGNINLLYSDSSWTGQVDLVWTINRLAVAPSLTAKA